MLTFTQGIGIELLCDPTLSTRDHGLNSHEPDTPCRSMLSTLIYYTKHCFIPGLIVCRQLHVYIFSSASSILTSLPYVIYNIIWVMLPCNHVLFTASEDS